MENTTNKKEPSKLLHTQTHLQLQDKSLMSIPKLNAYNSLSVLYLHNNKIKTIENVSIAAGLTCLYLHNNNITKLENLSSLFNLKKLFLSHNRISVVENLEGLVNLEELYLEKQNLNKGESLCFDPRTVLSIADLHVILRTTFIEYSMSMNEKDGCDSYFVKTLQVLNISNNNIPSISVLEPMKNLRLFNVSNNNIQHIDDILNTIQHWYHLSQAEFVGNPVAKKHRYRENIIGKTIRLEILDNKQINETTRCFIKRFEKEQSNQPRNSINLVDFYPGLPKNYSHPLQKAVSSSVIKTGLAAMNFSTGETANYIPWNALPRKTVKLKRKDVKHSLKRTEKSDEREILRIQV